MEEVVEVAAEATEEGIEVRIQLFITSIIILI